MGFFGFVLLTALIHILILVIRTIKEGNIKLLNYFGILDLNAFFPRITQGWVSDMISVLLISIILGVFLLFSFRKY